MGKIGHTKFWDALRKNGWKVAIVLGLLVVVTVVLSPKCSVSQPQTTSSLNSENSSSEAVLEKALKEKKVTLLCFHSTTCASCIEMEETIEDIKPRFDKKVVFISVIVSDLAERSLVEKYEIQFIPTTFIYDKRGEIAQKYVGPVSKDELVKMLNELE